MESIKLPREIAYDQQLPALPSETTNSQTVLAPVNGSSFADSALIQFDIPARGFLQPDTMYLRFKASVVASGTSLTIAGTPATTFFQKLETIFGSQIVESVQDWGVVQNLLFNLQLNTAQKVGSVGLGYLDNSTTATFANMNGRNYGTTVSATTYTAYFAVPLNCILSSCEKLVPLFAMPNVRIQLTTDSIANIFPTSATSFSLTNIELVYDCIDMGAGVESAVKQMGEKLYIKSQSFVNSSNTLASGTSGTVELIYNQRLSSIKSLFALFQGTSANSVNKKYDAYDPTSSSGSLQYSIAGINYPSRELSTINNKGSFWAELKQAIGGIHNLQTTNFGITPLNFNRVGNDTTTVGAPASFFFGVNVEKLSTNGALLTGISTNNSSISVRINTSTATAQTHNVALVCMYDAIIEVDTVMRNASVKQ
jgi:hypothetical protein